MKFNWGTAIVLSFVLFASFVMTLVVKMLGSGNDLLAPKNYHSAQEINRDLKLIASSARVRKEFSLAWSEDSRTLMLRFGKKPASGSVRLTCLSDAGADHRFSLALQHDSAGWFQKVNLPKAVPGNWLAEIRGLSDADSMLIKSQFRIY